MSNKTDSGVLTARAWGSEVNGELHGMALADYSPSYNFDDACIIVHIPGLTHDQMEQDILAGLSLLAKSREVCEWRAVKSTHKRPIVLEWVASGHYAYPPETRVGCAGVIRPYHNEEPKFCPSCGRRVEVKE